MSLCEGGGAAIAASGGSGGGGGGGSEWPRGAAQWCSRDIGEGIAVVTPAGSRLGRLLCCAGLWAEAQGAIGLSPVILSVAPERSTDNKARRLRLDCSDRSGNPPAARAVCFCARLPSTRNAAVFAAVLCPLC